jgi:integrase
MLRTALLEGDNMQGKRTHALDSRGRPVPGLYLRDSIFIAGAKVDGRWRMRALEADTLTDARHERESWLAGLREGRVPSRSQATVARTFEDWQASRRLSERTRTHEQHVFGKRLGTLAGRRVQDVTPTDLAAALRAQHQRYADLSCVQTYRLLAGTFAHALRRGLIVRNPIDGLAPSERPSRRNKRQVARLDAHTLTRLVDAAGTLRWRVAFALAGYAGLRLGEIRALRWENINLEADTVTVRGSALPSGTVKLPKTEAGVRTVPLLPALRRLLVEWKLQAPRSRPRDLVVSTVDGNPVQERNVRRAFAQAKQAAGLDGGEDRLSMRCGTRSRPCSRPTSSCRLRRWQRSSDTRTPGSRCGRMRGMRATWRRSWRTCFRGPRRRASVADSRVSQPFSQPWPSPAVGSCRSLLTRFRLSKRFGASCRLVADTAFGLGDQRSRVRISPPRLAGLAGVSGHRILRAG